MTPEEIAKLLAKEIKSKKKFVANWDSDCDGCGESILQDDEFIFMGDKQKICTDCIDKIINFLED